MTEQSQRVVLITGAAGGIGQAAVNLFHERGWRVIGVDRKERPDRGYHNERQRHRDDRRGL